MFLPIARRQAFGLLLALGSCAGAQAGPQCAASIAQLQSLVRSKPFALKWRETSMDDGKPLLLSLLERDGLLALQFIKSGEGLWVEAGILVCRQGDSLEARFAADQVRMGPAAGWMVQRALSSGGRFTLTEMQASKLRVETTGWAGFFEPDRD